MSTVTTPTNAPLPKAKDKDPKVIHQLDKTGRHRLVVNGEVGEASEADGIATCGDFCATCTQHSEVLPQVFKVTPVTEFTVQTDVNFSE